MTSGMKKFGIMSLKIKKVQQNELPSKELCVEKNNLSE